MKMKILWFPGWRVIDRVSENDVEVSTTDYGNRQKYQKIMLPTEEPYFVLIELIIYLCFIIFCYIFRRCSSSW
jgi:hypothetical protein